MARRRGFLTRLIDRATGSVPQVVESEQAVEQRAEPDAEAGRRPLSAAPRGIVYEGVLQPGAVAAWMSAQRQEYTVADLRQAARLPVVSMILATIIRDLHSYDLRVDPPESEGDDRDADVALLRKILAKPYSRGLDTLRTATGQMSRDLMVLGHSDVEIMRGTLGQAKRVLRAFKALPKEDQNLARLERQIEEAEEEYGPIRGWQVVDPEPIRVNMDEHGTLQDPAFYDVSSVYGGMVGIAGNVAYQPSMISWDTWHFCRLIWQATTERDKRATGVGSVEDGYPLIDILWTVLVRLADEVDQPTRDKILSFQTRSETPLTNEQIDLLVAGIRVDMQSGRLPVLGGVQVGVADYGPRDSLDYMNLVDQISVMLWVLFGTGMIEMGHVDTSSRATAEAQITVARRQAVGNLKKILLDDFFVGTIGNDPFSEFLGLLLWWEDTGSFLSVQDRMDLLEPLMRFGLPVGAVIEKEFPGYWDLLERYGINPMELLPPSALSATIAGGAEVPESTSEEVEESMAKLRELLSRAG